jgi:hypothetical protein
MRGYRVVVPSDCVASERADDTTRALQQMSRLLKADIASAPDLAVSRLLRPAAHD